MYPAHGAALFPPFPRDNRVFVAMSFEAVFTPRWINVIQPGIREAGLEPYRVDLPRASASIPADIITGICRARLIFADITATGGQRNGNVMYEVGLAHALRQPDEVLLFRSDRDQLLFDVAPIRVNHYAPDTDGAASRASVTDAAQTALREVDTLKALAVGQVTAGLDATALAVLFEICAGRGAYEHPAMSLASGPTLTALLRLLELGVVQASWPALSPEEVGAAKTRSVGDYARRFVRYRATERLTSQAQGVTDRLSRPGVGKW
jgi:hypothetical protein